MTPRFRNGRRMVDRSQYSSREKEIQQFSKTITKTAGSDLLGEENLTINNLSIIKQEIGGTEPRRIYWIFDLQNTYSISRAYPYRSKDEDFGKICAQSLSTFKFID